MTMIGDKLLLASQSMLLADGEVGRMEVQVGETVLPIAVRFSSPHDEEPASQWRLDNGILVFEFTGWNNPLGTGFRRAKRIGEVAGEPLGFNIAHQRLGALNVAHFQLYMRGTYV